MAMRREAGAQDDLVATWAEIPRSPGHAFYDRLQTLLKEAGFDVLVEDVCKPLFPPAHGRLLRRDRQRTRHCLALLGFAVAAGLPAACEPGQGSRSLLAVENALTPAARSS